MGTDIAPAKKQQHPAIALLNTRKDTILKAIPETFRAALAWERIETAVASALMKNPALSKCSPQSILMSIMDIVGKGLDIGMDGQAYLVPFRGECTPMIGAQGKIELAYRSGQIVRIVVQVLYENDEFELDLANGTISHKMDREYLRALAKGETERGEMLAGYARIWLKDSPDPILELMTVAEFNQIRDTAQRKGGGRLSPAYQEWPAEMFRRSVLNRALKRAPKSRDLMEVLSRETRIEFGDDEPRSNVIDAMPPDALPDHGEPQDVEAELDRLKSAEKVPAVSIRTEIDVLVSQLGGKVGEVRRQVGLPPGTLPADLDEARLIEYRDALQAAARA